MFGLQCLTFVAVGYLPMTPVTVQCAANVHSFFARAPNYRELSGLTGPDSPYFLKQYS